MGLRLRLAPPLGGAVGGGDVAGRAGGVVVVGGVLPARIIGGCF